MMALMEGSKKSPTPRHPLKSIGPSYKEVAKNMPKPADQDILAKKNPSGGEGSWGLVPMPPHPPHNIEETQQMVDTILGMRKEAE